MSLYVFTYTIPTNILVMDVQLIRRVMEVYPNDAVEVTPRALVHYLQSSTSARGRFAAGASWLFVVKYSEAIDNFINNFFRNYTIVNKNIFSNYQKIYYLYLRNLPQIFFVYFKLFLSSYRSNQFENCI